MDVSKHMGMGIEPTLGPEGQSGDPMTLCDPEGSKMRIWAKRRDILIIVYSAFIFWLSRVV